MLHKSKVKWADFALGILGIYSRLDCYSARQRQEWSHIPDWRHPKYTRAHKLCLWSCHRHFYTHTFEKREQMERVTSLLTSERMQTWGLRQLLLSGGLGITPRRTGTCISPNSWQSQNEASRHLLKPYSIAYISPFSPHFFLIPTLSILFSLLLTKPEFQCVFGLILWVSLI